MSDVWGFEFATVQECEFTFHGLCNAFGYTVPGNFSRWTHEWRDADGNSIYMYWDGEYEDLMVLEGVFAVRNGARRQVCAGWNYDAVFRYLAQLSELNAVPVDGNGYVVPADIANEVPA